MKRGSNFLQAYHDQSSSLVSLHHILFFNVFLCHNNTPWGAIIYGCK